MKIIQPYIDKQAKIGRSRHYMLTGKQHTIRFITLGGIMKRIAMFLVLAILFPSSAVFAQAMTYNQLDVVNLNDQGLPADERSTNILITKGNVVYGATSGEKCH